MWKIPIVLSNVVGYAFFLVAVLFLLQYINEIDNPIRSERNRMIHDFWIGLDDGTVQRSQLKPKVIKSQAHQRKLVLANYKPITPNDISILCAQIEKASVDVIVHWDAYIHSGRLRSRPSPRLPGRPD